MKHNVMCFLGCFILVNQFVFADSVRYSERKLIYKKSDKLLVVHMHDWRDASIKKRRKMFFGDQNPFSEKNDYSWLECLDGNTNHVIFSKQVPALTYLYISSDSKFIIGLSNIMFLNPVQMVVFDSSGKLIFDIAISSEEAKMTMEDYIVFKKKFPRDSRKFTQLKRVIEFENWICINYGTHPPLSDKAWEYLYKWNSRSHLSKNFAESVSNFIDWYKEPDPEIQLKYENEKLTVVSLLDPAGERFEIKIK